MQLIKFNEYNNSQSFEEKIEDDTRYTSIILSNLANYLNGHDLPSFKSTDELEEYLNDICYTNGFLDETDLPHSMDELHDLCVYGAPDEKINSTWDNLLLEMNNVALSALIQLASIHLNTYSSKFIEFFEKNNLDVGEITINSTDPHGYAKPTKVVKLDDETSVYQYRNLDGSYNVDVYEFEYQNITLYITNKL